jgi:hypothetical protein
MGDPDTIVERMLWLVTAADAESSACARQDSHRGCF